MSKFWKSLFDSDVSFLSNWYKENLFVDFLSVQDYNLIYDYIINRFSFIWSNDEIDKSSFYQKIFQKFIKENTNVISSKVSYIKMRSH
jgi:hypothetical protein